MIEAKHIALNGNEKAECDVTLINYFKWSALPHKLGLNFISPTKCKLQQPTVRNRGINPQPEKKLFDLF